VILDILYDFLNAGTKLILTLGVKIGMPLEKLDKAIRKIPLGLRKPGKRDGLAVRMVWVGRWTLDESLGHTREDAIRPQGLGFNWQSDFGLLIEFKTPKKGRVQD